MGPNANGYLSNELKLNASEFVRRQLGMLHELLTNYGTDYVSRLWWDHYPSGCGGLAPCPAGSFPDAWPQFVELVRKVSPSTIICPGPDCDGHQSESGVGKYPVWYPCDPGTGDSLTCRSHAADDNLTGFHPYETCATMNNGWFAKGNGTPPSDTYWSPASIWDHYMFSVGIGFVNTLNAPPGTTGQIDQHLVDSMTVFGDALRSLLKPVSASAATTKPQTLQCGDSAAAAIELDLGAPSTFNSVITKEDLSGGQRIRSYAVDYFDAAADAWKSLPQCTDGESCIPGSSPTGHTVPPTPRGSCSQPMLGVNLVSDAPPSCKLKGTVTTAAACEALCKADPLANFWTWHDEQVTPPSFRGKCYCREDSAFAYRDEAHHVSGVCNHTLHGGNSLGVRGQSVGFNVIDWVPNTTASKVRFRCTSSMAADGSATVASFSVHHGTRPSE